MPKASDWRELIAKVLDEQAPSGERVLRAFGPAEIDRWVEAQVHAESGGDPLARSGVGAVGLLQLMPLTAQELGLKVSVFADATPDQDERKDPEKNLRAGVRYLLQQYQRARGYAEAEVDQIRWAFAAYNCGWGYVRRALVLMGEDREKVKSVPKGGPWWEGRAWLAHRDCVVNGRRPLYHEPWNYVDRIERYFLEKAGRD